MAVREPCNARKLVEYDPLTKEALVYHIGKHSSFLKIDKQAKHDEVKKRFESYTNKTNLPVTACSSKALGIKSLENPIDEGKFEEAEREAFVWVDRRLMQRVR